MTDYTTQALVSAELNALTINASTTPSSDSVATWITESSRDVELLTNQVWGSTLVSSEYHDYDGGGVLFTYNKPIISISELLAESNGINASSEGWYSLTEGRLSTQDFIVYTDEGEVNFHGTQMPIAGYQNLAISYIHGYTSTPTEIQRLTTLLTAKRVIFTITDGSATSEGGSISIGTITVSDPNTFSHKHIQNMDMEISQILNSIGKFKTYRVDRR